MLRVSTTEVVEVLQRGETCLNGSGSDWFSVCQSVHMALRFL